MNTLDFQCAKKRVLISGGLGFIGSQVAICLASLGHEIVVVDSLLSNVMSTAELQSIHPSIRIFECDIVDYIHTCSADLHTFDTVLHAASIVGAVKVIEYLGVLAHEIVHTTQVVANACLENELDLIAISSSEVYGRSGLLAESDKLVVNPNYNARIEYGIGKMATECMISNLGHKGLKSLMLRPFNVVGARQNAKTGFVLANFVQQALRNEPLTVFHDGNQERSFTSVIDMAEFIGRIISTSQTLPERLRGKILNIGNSSNKCSVRDLALLVNQKTGNKLGYRFVDPAELHGSHFFESDSIIKLADDRVARAHGWNPKYNLEQIVSDVIKHYSQHSVEKVVA